MCCLVSMFLPVVSLEARLTYKQVLFWVSRRSGGARSFAASPLAFAAPPLAFVAPPFVRDTPGGGGVLLYMALTGTCCQIGYGFQGSLVLNGVTIS